MQTQMLWHWSHPHVSLYKSRHQMQCQKQWHLSHPHVSIYKSCHQMQSQKQWHLHSPPPTRHTDQTILTAWELWPGWQPTSDCPAFVTKCALTTKEILGWMLRQLDQWTRVAIKLKYTVYRIRNCFMPLQIYNRLVPSICILMSRDF